MEQLVSKPMLSGLKSTHEILKLKRKTKQKMESSTTFSCIINKIIRFDFISFTARAYIKLTKRIELCLLVKKNCVKVIL